MDMMWVANLVMLEEKWRATKLLSLESLGSNIDGRVPDHSNYLLIVVAHDLWPPLDLYLGGKCLHLWVGRVNMRTRSDSEPSVSVWWRCIPLRGSLGPPSGRQANRSCSPADLGIKFQKLSPGGSDGNVSHVGAVSDDASTVSLMIVWMQDGVNGSRLWWPLSPVSPQWCLWRRHRAQHSVWRWVFFINIEVLLDVQIGGLMSGLPEMWTHETCGHQGWSLISDQWPEHIPDPPSGRMSPLGHRHTHLDVQRGGVDIKGS